jgi:hypothetical protein
MTITSAAASYRNASGKRQSTFDIGPSTNRRISVEGQRSKVEGRFVLNLIQELAAPT